MSPSLTRTAVLLFTRSAGEEAAHKSFGAGGRGADAAVAAQLIAQATATARQAGVDFLYFGSDQQAGGTFGQRLSSALAYGFGRGYERLVVIGNDCPQLTPARLRQAVAALETTDAVLGPDLDGGVYLLGVSRAFFAADVWAALPWQTARLGAALARCLHRAGASVRRLRPLAGINNARHLARVLRQLPATALRRRLEQLRRPVRVAGRALRLRPRVAAVAAPLPLRGPPVS
ncbi:TIGR04282 family arsenosugar biosynthesis glycosyltransferase [Hymenobacter actinosclerus]|uniref:DUF2064 domain-containing protein n=1 Tax=Hymenobacter actinosclerus TaxID=82805 RepID=A0A1I0ERY4_9BACT|nr:DUF2064 domain-containing protein [Hymenobacter actinosclerus]SET48101.1 hypothetical protein SAMN04487998_1969 [Hymenobacter actinosclerus]